MEQGVSSLPTQTQSFGMSQPQAIPSRLDFSSISNFRNSPASRTSWEDRIIDLSSELQQICGSPSTPPFIITTLGGGSSGRNSPQWPTPGGAAAGGQPSPPSRPNRCSPPAQGVDALPTPPPRVVRPGSERRHVRWSTVTPPLLSALGRCADAGATACGIEQTSGVMTAAGIGGGLVRRTISLQCQQGATSSPAGGSGRPRPIMVRHVETPEKLASRLSAICGSSCGSKQEPETRKQQSSSPTPRPDTVHRRPSLVRPDSTTGSSNGAGGKHGGGIRLKTVIAPYRSDDVIVSVRDGRQLAVEAFTNGGAMRRLHGVDLLPVASAAGNAAVTDVAKRLMCHVTSSGWLYVLERPGTSLSVDYVGVDVAYLPVINCDEDRLEMSLILGVPDDFRFEDIAVKTVDDDVWITGNGSGGASPPPPDGAVFDFPPPRQFKVVVPLPEGTDNRSVIAALTPRNQVVVKARLGNTSRRYTF